MKFIHKTICFAATVAILIPTVLQADSIEPVPSPRVAVMLLADRIGTETGISPKLIKNILKHESNYLPGAVGDHGLARNVAQYHEDEFDRYEKKYLTQTGQPLNYNSAQDQITLMAYQFKYYPSSRHDWSTYTALYGNKKVS